MVTIIFPSRLDALQCTAFELVGNWKFRISSSGAWMPNGRIYKGLRICPVSLCVRRGPQQTRLFSSYTVARKFQSELAHTKSCTHRQQQSSFPRRLSDLGNLSLRATGSSNRRQNYYNRFGTGVKLDQTRLPLDASPLVFLRK